MAPMRRNLTLPRWLAGILLASLAGVGLAGCGSAVGVVGEGAAALASVASTQTGTQSSNTIVASTGSVTEDPAATEMCSPGLHCAP
jgi:anti-sigma factor RsiW